MISFLLLATTIERERESLQKFGFDRCLIDLQDEDDKKAPFHDFFGKTRQQIAFLDIF